VEDKRNESDRERTSQREAETVVELRTNKGGGGGNGHVAGVPRSTAHNVRKRIGESGRKTRTSVKYVG